MVDTGGDENVRVGVEWGERHRNGVVHGENGFNVSKLCRDVVGW